LACSEFTDPLRELPTIDPRFFRERLVDLRGIADDQWISLGVKPEHIERHSDCSKCDVDRWWSLRGGDKDEMAKGARNLLTISLL
jgi:copper oxidase (laccase) domain-containing protein